MNFKKVMAGSLASIMAVSSLAVAASAKGYTPTDEEKEKYQPWCSAGENWLITLHEDGDPETGKEEIDFGVDPTTLDSFTIYVDIVKNPNPKLGVLELDKFQKQINEYYEADPATRGDFMYSFAGSFIYAANSGDFGTEAGNELYDKYNWPNSEWWSIPAKGDTIEGRYLSDVVEGLPDGKETNRSNVAYNKKLHMDYIDDFRYSITYDVANYDGGSCKWPAQGEGTTAGLYRVGLQEWSNVTAFQMKPSLLVCRDSSGEIVLAFDGYGNVVENDEAKKLSDEMNALAEEAAKTPVVSETTAAESEAPANTEAANNSEAAAPTTTAAPASSSSSGPNVGLIIGIIAAVVVVAVVVVIVIKKKK